MNEAGFALTEHVDGDEGNGSVGRPGGGRLFAVRGLLSGVAGGLCCFAGAIAVGLGLGGASFFATVMGRYQLFFLLASLVLMGFWLTRAARGAAGVGGGVRGVVRAVGRPVLLMGVTWSVTLVAAMVAARAVGLG